MRRTRAALTTSLVMLTFACASGGGPEPAPAAAPAPSAFDPSGMYDFIATMGIEARSGTLEIARADDGGFQGEAWLEGEGQPALIESGTVADRHVVLNGRVNGSIPVRFELDFEGADFSGWIVVPDDSVVVDGTRRGS